MYETKTDSLGLRPIGGAWDLPSDKRVLSPSTFTVEETTRTDNYAGATVELEINDVLAEGTGLILAIPHEKASSGDILTWQIVSGNSSGDFSITNEGELRRVVGHALVGPYTLTVTATSGSPLYRAQRFSVSVTVAA